MKTQATLAVLVKNGAVVGTTVTTARNGALVDFGKQQLKDSGVLTVGSAKISRAKKYLNNKELMYNLEMSDAEFVVTHSNYLDA